MDENKISCASADSTQRTWNNIDWSKCEATVKKLQARIVKAQKDGKHGKVKSLQWLLTHSFAAKALAVKRVTSNQGKKTAGVDKVLWSTPESKFKAISTLKRRGYKPKPLKRIYIDKKNGKKRPLGIPTMKDRAMQALYLLALDPIAETTADPNSYGFRKERSTFDAREQCFCMLAKKDSPQWILEGDIKGCFDHISHEWLLNNIPMDKAILHKWLKCGYVFKSRLFDTVEGTPQGGIISPTLANMTLNGLEAILKSRFKTHSRGGYTNYKVHLIRYADDFIITGASKELLANEVLPIVNDFMRERGLELSQEKTKITHISDGFDFIGYNVRKYNGKMLISPTKESVKRFLGKIREVVDGHKAVRQDSLIRLLNPIITGWSNYYRYCVASKIFHSADRMIFNKLWQWSLRRHPKKGKYWVANKYFHTVRNRKWTFSYIIGKGQSETRTVLKRLSDIKITRFIKIKAEANPYDTEWTEYFEKRYTYKMLCNLNGKKSLLRIWERQKRICPICGKPIDKNQPWSMTESNRNGRKENILVHDSCKKILNLNKRNEPTFS